MESITVALSGVVLTVSSTSLPSARSSDSRGKNIPRVTRARIVRVRRLPPVLRWFRLLATVQTLSHEMAKVAMGRWTGHLSENSSPARGMLVKRPPFARENQHRKVPLDPKNLSHRDNRSDDIAFE